MATTVYFDHDAAGSVRVDMHRGTNSAKLDGTAVGWVPLGFRTTRGSGAIARATSTVNGPTNGVEVVSSGQTLEWISQPIDQDVTISGSVTFNVWAHESSMSAETTIACIIERLDSQGAVASTIIQSSFGTELGTSSAAKNWTGSPTSTNMLKGDRFRARLYGDDRTASTMATGFTFSVTVGGATGGADGDSFITFNETFGFLTTTPAGSTLYLTDTAGPAVGANIEKEMWTSRGDGVNSIVVNTAAGWTSPIQWTDSGGGTVVEWYSKQLQAFTLADLVRCNLRALESNAAANCGIRAELAVCNNDGSSAVIWAAQDYQNTSTAVTELGTSESAHAFDIAGDDTSVTEGQRLRLRVYIDDTNIQAMAASQTATLYYDGTSGGASGDSYITLSQSVSEFSSTFAPPPKSFYLTRPHILTR